MPIGWAITVVVLCVAVAALAIVVLGLLRQMTPVLERAMAVAAEPDVRPLGPAVGSPLPHFVARGADGEVTAEQLRGRPAVLLFLTAGCSPCKALAEEMAHTDLGDLADQLVVITGPDGRRELGIRPGLRILTEQDGEVSGPLSVMSTPFAIAIGPDGIVKAVRVPNTIEQLDNLAAILS